MRNNNPESRVGRLPRAAVLARCTADRLLRSPPLSLSLSLSLAHSLSLSRLYPALSRSLSLSRSCSLSYPGSSLGEVNSRQALSLSLSLSLSHTHSSLSLTLSTIHTHTCSPTNSLVPGAAALARCTADRKFCDIDFSNTLASCHRVDAKGAT